MSRWPAVIEGLGLRLEPLSQEHAAPYEALLQDVRVHPVGERVVAVSYAISPGDWRRGFGGRALRTLVEALFASARFDRIEASTHRENAASAALLCSVGFEEVEPQQAPPRRRFQMLPKA